MSRNRSQVIEIPYPEGQLRVSSNYYTINDGGNPLSYTNSMTDQVTPGFFKAAKTGAYIPMNPMSKSRIDSWDHTPAALCHWKSAYWVWLKDTPLAYQGLWAYCNVSTMGQCIERVRSDYGFPSGSFLLSSSNELATEAIARARTTGLDAGTFAAEFSKTIALITRFQSNTFRRAGRILDEMKRKKVRPSQLWRVFSEMWLEARYGWRTLNYDIQDINNAVEALKEGISTSNRAYAQDEDTRYYTWSTSNLKAKFAPNGSVSRNNYSKMDASSNGTMTRVRRAGCFVDLVLDDVGFIDPLTTTWEIIPFSFIVDWFVNIGDLVSSLSPFAAGEIKGIWTSERDTINRSFSTVALPNTTGYPAATVVGTTTGILSMQSTIYSRTTLSKPPLSLSFKMDLDEYKLIDLAALFALRYTKLLRKLLPTSRL